jgi:signal transduction histidine kinase
MRIQSAAGRMRALIQDLLTLSRVTSKARPFVLVELTTIARETLGDLEVPISESEAVVEVHDLPPAHADTAQMRQLFQNLIGNALKFRRPGEPPRVVVSGKADGDRVEIAVEDNGIGFEDRYADRIFKPFQRLHAREKYPGTGIGLAICKKIVDRHGGELRVTSAPGRGSTFLVILPAAPREPIETEGEAR